MNIFEKIKKIESILNTFDDTEFISVVSEDEVLIKNTKNDSVWSINYFENDGEITFNTSSAVKISNHESDEDQEDFQEDLKSKIKTFLLVESESSEEDLEDKEDEKILVDEETVSDIRDVLERISFKNQTIDSVVTESLKSSLAQNERETLTNEQLSVVDALIVKHKAKIEEFLVNENEFLQNGRLFGEDQAIVAREDIQNPIELINKYREKIALQNLINESSEMIKDFYLKVAEEVEGEKVTQILENIHFSKDVETDTLKKLITEGYKPTEAREIGKKIADIYQETLSDLDVTAVAFEDFNSIGHSVDNGERLKFLRFNQGLFSKKETAELLEDFDKVVATFQNGRNTQESFNEVMTLRTIVENMLLTNTFDDEQISKIIITFNNKFGAPGNFQAPSVTAGTGV